MDNPRVPYGKPEDWGFVANEAGGATETDKAKGGEANIEVLTGAKDDTKGSGSGVERPDGLVFGEVKDGLPVLDVEEYERFYNTDIREAGAGVALTFDFQGFLKLPPGPEYGLAEAKYVYTDVMATNGILKTDKHKGMHIGIDGIPAFNFPGGRNNMESANQVAEYSVFITIPGKMQKEHGCVCSQDSCFSISEFKKRKEKHDSNPEFSADEEIHQKQHQEQGWVTIESTIQTGEDPLAREKMQFINNRLVGFIEGGGNLYEIEGFFHDMKKGLEGISREDLENNKLSDVAGVSRQLAE